MTGSEVIDGTLKNCMSMNLVICTPVRIIGSLDTIHIAFRDNDDQHSEVIEMDGTSEDRFSRSGMQY
jgi:predicted DNA-binding protein with PD1-like motif